MGSGNWDGSEIKKATENCDKCEKQGTGSISDI